MNVLEKMNELVGGQATKEQIKNWAYMNRITVMQMPDEDEFVTLEETINRFIEEYDYHSKPDEHEAWSAFLDFEYIDAPKAI